MELKEYIEELKTKNEELKKEREDIRQEKFLISSKIRKLDLMSTGLKSSFKELVRTRLSDIDNEYYQYFINNMDLPIPNEIKIKINDYEQKLANLCGSLSRKSEEKIKIKLRLKNLDKTLENLDCDEEYYILPASLSTGEFNFIVDNNTVLPKKLGDYNNQTIYNFLILFKNFEIIDVNPETNKFTLSFKDLCFVDRLRHEHIILINNNVSFSYDIGKILYFINHDAKFETHTLSLLKEDFKFYYKGFDDYGNKKLELINK